MRPLRQVGKDDGGQPPLAPKGASREIVLLVALVGIAAGVLAGLALAPVPSPTLVGGFPGQGDSQVVEVTLQEFTDERQVELDVELEQARQVLAPASGIVTDWACEAGGELRSGTSPLSLNGGPVVALATVVPLWRDLAAGASGDDVEALQMELNRLGFVVEVTGRYDDLTRRAVADLLEGQGAGGSDGRLRLSSVIWLPTRSAAILGCDVQIGSPVNNGTAIASLEPRIKVVRIRDRLPTGVATGERHLVIGDLHLIVDATGRMDPSDFADLMRTEAFQIFRESDGAVGIRGTYLLAEPMTVGNVPPGAIVVDPAGTSCVVAGDGSVRAVRVVGSVAGRSLVEWLDTERTGSPPVTVRTRPEDVRECL